MKLTFINWLKHFKSINATKLLNRDILSINDNDVLIIERKSTNIPGLFTNVIKCQNISNKRLKVQCNVTNDINNDNCWYCHKPLFTISD